MNYGGHFLRALLTNISILSQFPKFHKIAILLQNCIICLHDSIITPSCVFLASSQMPHHHACHVITSFVIPLSYTKFSLPSCPWLFLWHYWTPLTSMTTTFNILPLWNWWKHVNILPLSQQWQRITCCSLDVTILIDNFIYFFFLTTALAKISPLLGNLSLCFSSSC